MRSALADTLREDFVTTAQAVGMPRHRVLQRATRNAILPVVALSAISFGFVISGAIVVETLFSWPGMGLLSYRAILNKDYPVMEGVFLVASAAVIIANLIADLALRLPRPAGEERLMAVEPRATGGHPQRSRPAAADGPRHGARHPPDLPEPRLGWSA